MNLRTFAGQHNPREACGRYGAVVREERFFCAVLFHHMLSSENALKEVLKRLEVPDAETRELGCVRIFVEYAMARDLWNAIGTDREVNDAKREFILATLKNPISLSEATIIGDFNRLLVAGPVSEDYIQSPARWGTAKIDEVLKGCECHELKLAHKLKWAFNVKPDIVIELDEDSVVCIEAKVESGQDVYSNGLPNDLRFTQTQCEVQGFLMRELLGFKNVHQVFLAPPKKNNGKEPSVEHVTHVTWATLLKDTTSTNKTVREAIARVIAIEKG